MQHAVKSPPLTFQISSVMHLLKQIIGPVHYGSRQIDSICHGIDFLEGVDKSPIRTAHGPPVLIASHSEFIKRSPTSTRSYRGGQIRTVQQWILRTADTRWINARFFIAEGTPLWTDIDNSVKQKKSK